MAVHSILFDVAEVYVLNFECYAYRTVIGENKYGYFAIGSLKYVSEAVAKRRTHSSKLGGLIT